jgi:hypothetical protein
MSKPSNTNYPYAFFSEGYLFLIFFLLCQILLVIFFDHIDFWRLLHGCPPLPIPNREVKPHSADGTWSKAWESMSLPIFKKPRIRGVFCFYAQPRFLSLFLYS